MNVNTTNLIPTRGRSLSLKMMGEVAKNFADECIADIFCVWDCYEKKWVKGSPVLIRFESGDLLIEGLSRLYEGAVDTSVACGAYSGASYDDGCLCWLPTNHLSTYIGENFKESELVSIITGFATQVAERWRVP